MYYSQYFNPLCLFTTHEKGFVNRVFSFGRCHLAAAAALPSPLSSAAISRILSTDDTEAGSNTDYEPNQERRICETTYCNKIAQKLLQSRDLSANPCEDFYKYACGSWEEHNPIPNNEVEWSEDHVVMEKTYKRIKNVLEEPDKPDDIPPVKMAKKLYHSCMNVDTIEEKGIQPIQEILDRTGGWPIARNGRLNQSSPSYMSWQEIDKRYSTILGTNAFYNLNLEFDPNNTNHYVLALDQGIEYPIDSLTESTKVYDDVTAYIDGFIKIIQTFANAKGYTLNKYRLRDDITKLILFELELRQLLGTEKENRDLRDNYKRMTIEELQQWYDSFDDVLPRAKINFLDVIQYIFKLGNVSINASEPIIVYNPEFLHQLAQLIGKTSQRTLVNYIQWNFVNKVLAYSTKEMRDTLFSMAYSSYNISNEMPRWKICVINLEMKDAISYMFVKKYISDSVIDKAKKMLENLKQEMRLRIKQTNWITEKGKKSLTQKLDTIEPQIGYPDWYKDEQAVTEYYKGLKISSDYFQNILNCVENDLIRNIKLFREPALRSQWTDLTYPITVNAFYAQTINAILIPAAELQDPYFTHLLPDAVNYGTTGFVIGHELSHSFDNEGIRYDEGGVKSDWISKEVFDGFENRTSCFVDQYDNYILDVKDENGENVQVDGNLTESENIADSIGLQVAFSAYKKIANQKPQSKLPGLENVSDDHLFFLAFANSWCAATRPEYEKDVINSDEHSPPKYRIIGSLSNLPEFSQTFDCPRQSPMNPQNKCNLWS
ncbi:endothelin-converting enzyme homolog [Calliopsis andreniformis]|uniref:endothelin-converting enzyme homolog n=1 Tax=Calliopsis andreniformis TaxID=337506 RepID=UPI003FCD41B6